MQSLLAPPAWAVLLSLALLFSPRAQAAAHPAGPTLTLTLHQAQRLAQGHNPELAAARLELQALEGAELQAGARPNPELGLQLEDTRSASRTRSWQLSQAIELGGKRAARMAVAARAREQAVVSLLARQAELRAAVASGFFELLGAQEQLRLAQAAADLAGQASAMAGQRLLAGKVPPLEHARARVAEAGVRADLAQAGSALRLARQRLAALLGQAELGVERAEGDAALLPALPGDDRVGALMGQAPAVRLAQLDMARRQALTDGERARRVPDLTLTLGAKREAELGRTQAVLGLSLPLPLMDRNEGHLMEALRREEQARELLRAATLRLQAEVAQALERLRLTREQAQRLRTELLPLAQTAYAAALKGYELGRFALPDVLDAQRSLFQAQQQALRHTAEAWRAATELDRMLGQDTQPGPQSQE